MSLSSWMDIWFSRLETFPNGDFQTTLSSEERSRANQIASPTSRLAFVRAHYALRTVLSRYTLTAANNLTFDRNVFGKPRLDQFPNLHFNLAHSASMALVAVGSQEVGVDVEVIKARGDEFSFARTTLATDEMPAFFNLPSKDKWTGLLRLWVRKEAILKASGVGLACDPNRIIVSPADQPARVVSVPFSFGFSFLWTLEDIDLGHDLIAAVATYGPIKLSIRS